MNNSIFEKARGFIYRNARPIDMALWRYHFENGSRQDVIDILSHYQNADGGFGHAIEADCWNTQSSPIGTWKAICLLNEIGVDANDDLVKKILKYLDSGKDFNGDKWYITVKSNNDHPHAVWHECNVDSGVPDDNPTVSLAGFVMKYGEPNSVLYSTCLKIVKNTVQRFINENMYDMHALICFLELYEYCAGIDNVNSIIELNKFKQALYSAIDKTVCKDSAKWHTDYVAKPSTYFNKNGIIFDILDKELCKKEGSTIIENQLPDGSYPVTWVWHNDYKEFTIAENWWKSELTRKYMLFLKAVEAL